MGGQEVDIGRREGDPGKALQAGRRGKELMTAGKTTSRDPKSNMLMGAAEHDKSTGLSSRLLGIVFKNFHGWCFSMDFGLLK